MAAKARLPQGHHVEVPIRGPPRLKQQHCNVIIVLRYYYIFICYKNK